MIRVRLDENSRRYSEVGRHGSERPPVISSAYAIHEMLDKIRTFFDQQIAGREEASADDADHRLRLATAALFIEMTQADFEVKTEETVMVSHAVQRALALSTDETEQLIALAREEVAESVSLYEFTRLINEGFTPEQKKRIVELLWSIAFADAEIEKHEEYLVRKIARLIHVPHVDFIEAKRKARAARNPE